MGAPKGNDNASKFNVKTIESICNLVADGENIKKACKKHNLDYTTFRRWKRENEIVYNLYIKAIQDKADMVDAQIDEIMDDLKVGKIEPSAANVLIQTLKWRAAKYYPKMFGDNSTLDLSNKDGSLKPIVDYSQLTDDELRYIREMQSKLNPSN